VVSVRLCCDIDARATRMVSRRVQSITVLLSCVSPCKADIGERSD
jgi:hypothetical protein